VNYIKLITFEITKLGMVTKQLHNSALQKQEL